LLLPLILPPFVGAIGLRHLLGREGSFNAILRGLGLINDGIDFTSRGGFWAVVLLEIMSLYPIVYLNLTAALANLDPALEEAACNLGAGAWRRFRRITMPLVAPGAFSGAVIVFIWSFTELGTPLMFEYRNVTSVQIFDGLKDMQASRKPFALVAVMLVVVAVSVAVEVEVDGDKVIRHLVNGEPVLEYEGAQLDPNDPHSQGLIAKRDGKLLLDGGTISLQSESHPIEFRRVEIQVLPARK
jgi:ABC-type Fe3+ transport system permease subunit